MANQTVYHNAPTGLTVYAYPQAKSLTDWTTHRVQLTEGSGDDVGRYSGAVDDAKGLVWVVFEQAAQPSSWDDQAAVITLPERMADEGTVDGGTATTTVIPVTGLRLTAVGSYVGQYFIQGADWREIVAYDGTEITLDKALPAAPGDGERFLVGGKGC